MKEFPNAVSFGEVSYEPERNPTPPPKKEKKKDPVVEFWKTQATICLLALLAVGVVRLVGGDIYRNVRDKYIELFCQTTSVKEMMEEPQESTPTPTVISTMATVTQTSIPVMAQGGGDSVDDRLAVKENELLLTSASANQMTVPVKGTVTSPFGYRIHPIYGTRLFHNGVDIGADSGTPIVAALSGVVEEAAYNESYGNYVILNHGKDFKTVYAHCSTLKAEVGEQVLQGDEIALVGSTGVSTGPHLHFEVRRGEYKVNPSWLVDLE